jgi:hypothetical protein
MRILVVRALRDHGHEVTIVRETFLLAISISPIPLAVDETQSSAMAECGRVVVGPLSSRTADKLYHCPVLAFGRAGERRSDVTQCVGPAFSELR